jgi:hypothetical protein
VLRAGLVFGCWGVVCALLAQKVDVAILQSREGGFYTDAVSRFHETLEKQGIAVQTLTFALKGDRSDRDLPRRILERKPEVITRNSLQNSKYPSYLRWSSTRLGRD